MPPRFSIVNNTLILTRPFPKRLTDRQRIALAMEKWQVLESVPVKVYGTGWNTCALCVKYMENEDGPPCDRCPVARYTGVTFCRETPFTTYDYMGIGTPHGGSPTREVAFLKRVLLAQTRKEKP